jgi:hypothetical protein
MRSFLIMAKFLLVFAFMVISQRFSVSLSLSSVVEAFVCFQNDSFGLAQFFLLLA